MEKSPSQKKNKVDVQALTDEINALKEENEELKKELNKYKKPEKVKKESVKVIKEKIKAQCDDFKNNCWNNLNKYVEDNITDFNVWLNLTSLINNYFSYLRREGNMYVFCKAEFIRELLKNDKITVKNRKQINTEYMIKK